MSVVGELSHISQKMEFTLVDNADAENSQLQSVEIPLGPLIVLKSNQDSQPDEWVEYPAAESRTAQGINGRKKRTIHEVKKRNKSRRQTERIRENSQH